MDSVYFGTLLGCICIYATGAYAQFYYMVPPPQSPPASTYYSTSFGNTAPFPFEPPAAMSFVSRSFGPSQSYYTTHQTFGNVAPAIPPIGYQTFTDNNFIQTPVGVQQQTGSATQVPTNTVFSTGATDQYRGFAYHTQLTGGGSANVFFLTGPEAHQVQQLQGFTSISTQNNTESQLTQKAKNLASNTLDSNATHKNQQQQIGDTLIGSPPGPAFEAIRSFLENSNMGFQQFYASNGQLFANTDINTNANIPANTVLLPAPISIQTFGNFPFIRSQFNTNENTTKNGTTSGKSDDKGEDVAESINTDIRVSPSTADIDTLTTSHETLTDASTTLTSLSTSTEESINKESTTGTSGKKSRSVKDETTKESISTETQSSDLKKETSSAQPSSTLKSESSSTTTKK